MAITRVKLQAAFRSAAAAGSFRFVFYSHRFISSALLTAGECQWRPRPSHSSQWRSPVTDWCNQRECVRASRRQQSLRNCRSASERERLQEAECGRSRCQSTCPYCLVFAAARFQAAGGLRSDRSPSTHGSNREMLSASSSPRWDVPYASILASSQALAIPTSLPMRWCFAKCRLAFS